MSRFLRLALGTLAGFSVLAGMGPTWSSQSARADVVIVPSDGSAMHTNIMKWGPGGASLTHTSSQSTPFDGYFMQATTAAATTAGTNKVQATTAGGMGVFTLEPTTFFGFGKLSINLDISDNTTGSNDLRVTLQLVDSNGSPLSDITVDLDESNASDQRLLAYSTAGEIFTSATLTPLGDASLEKVSDVRIDKIARDEPNGGGGGGGGGNGDTMPEPASVLVWCVLGLAGMGWAWRSRKRRPA